MSRIRNFKLEGLVPAVFTPMKRNCDVDYDMIDPYCQHLADNGITQIYVNGGTGEGLSLTLEERKKVLEKWIEVGKKSGRIKDVVVHVGAVNLRDTLSLVSHAVSVGADAIAAVPSLFFKPATVDQLVEYCKEIAGAAPDIPLYYYHIPSRTNVPNYIDRRCIAVCMEDFLIEAAKQIPSFAGVKFSSLDLVDLIGCLYVKAPHRDDKKFNLVFGCDNALIAGTATGTDGAVGSLYNAMPALFNRILKNLADGKFQEARDDQYRAQQACRISIQHASKLGDTVASWKAVMSLIGLDLGPARIPMKIPTEEDLLSLKTDFERIGFFNWYK